MFENKQIPIVDIFAGPGGLGEGFSAVKDPISGDKRFRVVLSIEKEDYAHKTLLLRAFFREFESGSVPNEYYQFLRGEITQDSLFNRYQNQYQSAENVAWKTELGAVNPLDVDKRINKALNREKLWVLIGGPPCQAYSVIGRSRYSRIWRDQPSKRDEDNRHYLYREYLRILAIHQPPVFVLENVTGLLSSKVSTGKIADKIFNDLRNPCLAIDGFDNKKGEKGYRLFSIIKNPRKYNTSKDPEFFPDDYIVRCERYGIPQARHRVIIVGIRDNINLKPEILEEQQSDISVEAIIGDLPKIRSGISKSTDSNYNWQTILRQMQTNGIICDPNIGMDVRDEILNQIDNLSDELERGGETVPMNSSPEPRILKEWFFDPNLKGVFNHSARGHIPEDLLRYFFAACFASVRNYSPTLKDFPVGLLPHHKNIIDGVEGAPFTDRFRVQLSGRPSTTITSHISKDGHYYIHPDSSQCRSLSVREAARLQTFPDNYYFMGPRTTQYHQVGNAVPPLLAYQIAEKVNLLFQKINNTKSRTDRISRERRSWNMSQIRSKNTKPELQVRSVLHNLGYRFRLHQKNLPGTPDIILKKHGTVIFVHGCYWHRHTDCKFASTPKSSVDFWEEKFNKNIERHEKVAQQLIELGWRVMVIWECEATDKSKLEGLLTTHLSHMDITGRIIEPAGIIKEVG